jgi:hypothetical protein
MVEDNSNGEKGYLEQNKRWTVVDVQSPPFWKLSFETTAMMDARTKSFPIWSAGGKGVRVSHVSRPTCRARFGRGDAHIHTSRPEHL